MQSNNLYQICRNIPTCIVPALVAGTREIVVHPNYVVVYRVTASAIEVINVLHSRQQYP